VDLKRASRPFDLCKREENKTGKREVNTKEIQEKNG
jgi:hypothetical protein